MVDYFQLIQYASIIVLIVGGYFTIKDQVKRWKRDARQDMISTIRTELEPIQVAVTKDKESILSSLNNKEQSINDLWKDLEIMEDHLNKLQVQVAEHKGAIEIQTPLIMEIRNQIDQLRMKLENIQTGLNIK